MRVQIIALGVIIAGAVAVGQEVAVPDKPVPSTITSYHIIGFSQEREPDWRFTIVYKDSNDKVYQDVHYGLSSKPDPAGGAPITNPEGADAFLKQMNTTNFSTTSMMKRLYQHLVTHGKIPASTVTGQPDGDNLDADMQVEIDARGRAVFPFIIKTDSIDADVINAIDSSLGTITAGVIPYTTKLVEEPLRLTCTVQQ